MLYVLFVSNLHANIVCSRTFFFLLLVVVVHVGVGTVKQWWVLTVSAIGSWLPSTPAQGRRSDADVGRCSTMVDDRDDDGEPAAPAAMQS